MLATNPRASGCSVLAALPIHCRRSQSRQGSATKALPAVLRTESSWLNPSTALSHSADNDGVVGLSDAENKSGVFGFNTKQQGTGYGVFGRCDATAPSRHDRATSIRDVA
jgi:hypothetical protein